MNSTNGRSLVAVVVALVAASVLAAALFTETKTAAQAAAVDQADAELRAGDVWEAANVLLNELRALPPAAESIDRALAPMHYLSFIMCSLMSKEDLSTFVQQLQPEKSTGDALALAAFYRDYRIWETVRGIQFLNEQEYGDFLKQLSASQVPLARMGALLYQILYVRDTTNREDRETGIADAMQLVNKMFDEGANTRVARECFREVLRHGLRRAGDVRPAAIRDFLTDPIWSNKMRQVIATEGVTQTLHGVLASAAVSQAKTNTDAIAGIVSGAMEASRSHADPNVRAWFRDILSSCIDTQNSYSSFGPNVRALFSDQVSFMLGDGAKPERVSLDVARAQYWAFMGALKELEAVQDGKGQSGPDLAHYATLLNQKRDVEPIETNYFERIPTEVTYYAYLLINQSQPEAAAALFRQVIALYPKSDLARRCQESLDVMAPILKIQAAQK